MHSHGRIIRSYLLGYQCRVVGNVLVLLSKLVIHAQLQKLEVHVRMQRNEMHKFTNDD